MSRVLFNKVTALPGTLQPNTLYFVENGSYAESYLTDSAGVAKSLGNSAMINALIQAALADFAADLTAVDIVTDIAARDALTATLNRNAMILVIDASADPTVGSGSALYAWDDASSTIYKIAEYESMDVVIQWASIQGGPSSTPAQIDLAVTNSHTHANKATLDKLGEGADGLTFDGQPVSPSWATNDW